MRNLDHSGGDDKSGLLQRTRLAERMGQGGAWQECVGGCQGEGE
jgi:hypothetical protein